MVCLNARSDRLLAVELVAIAGAEAYRPEVHRVLAEVAEVAGDEPIRRIQLESAHRLYSGMEATGHARSLVIPI